MATPDSTTDLFQIIDLLQSTSLAARSKCGKFGQAAEEYPRRMSGLDGDDDRSET
jgi:hypothetical protein